MNKFIMMMAIVGAVSAVPHQRNGENYEGPKYFEGSVFDKYPIPREEPIHYEQKYEAAKNEYDAKREYEGNNKEYDGHNKYENTKKYEGSNYLTFENGRKNYFESDKHYESAPYDGRKNMEYGEQTYELKYSHVRPDHDAPKTYENNEYNSRRKFDENKLESGVYYDGAHKFYESNDYEGSNYGQNKNYESNRHEYGRHNKEYNDYSPMRYEHNNKEYAGNSYNNRNKNYENNYERDAKYNERYGVNNVEYGALTYELKYANVHPDRDAPSVFENTEYNMRKKFNENNMESGVYYGDGERKFYEAVQILPKGYAAKASNYKQNNEYESGYKYHGEEEYNRHSNKGYDMKSYKH